MTEERDDVREMVDAAARVMALIPGRYPFPKSSAQTVLASLGIPLSVLAVLRRGEWKAVPVVPTREMEDALVRNEAYCDSCHGTSFDAINGYSAMLSAAPLTPDDI